MTSSTKNHGDDEIARCTTKQNQLNFLPHHERQTPQTSKTISQVVRRRAESPENCRDEGDCGFRQCAAWQGTGRRSFKRLDFPPPLALDRRKSERIAVARPVVSRFNPSSGNGLGCDNQIEFARRVSNGLYSANFNGVVNRRFFETLQKTETQAERVTFAGVL